MKRGKAALSSQFRRLALRLCEADGVCFVQSPTNAALLAHVRRILGVKVKADKRGDMARAIPMIVASNLGEPIADYGAAKLALTEGFYRSAEWREARYHALLASNGRCECCGAGKPEGVVLHVDHIKPRSRFPQFALDLANLQVLCADCNLGKGAADQTDWRARPATEGQAA